MFIAGMNYGNGLALLFTFWLTGFALVAMVQTQRDLAGTRISVRQRRLCRQRALHRWSRRTGPADLRGGAGAAVELTHAAGGPHLHGCRLRRCAGPVRRHARTLARAAATAALRLTRRALRPVPHLDLAALDVGTLVYPRPPASLPVPETPGEDAGSRTPRHGLDELAWLRDFREGDSPRQVAWKAYARGAPLLVREYRGKRRAAREFDFAALRDLRYRSPAVAARRWMRRRRRARRSWTLRLPGDERRPGDGATIWQRCLHDWPCTASVARAA